MTLGTVQNLRGFATSQPPLLVFTLCLMAFGFTVVTLAFIIGEKDLPNPDIDLDWNVFLRRLSELHYCVDHNVDSLRHPTELIKNTDVNVTTSSNTTANVPVVKAVDRAKSLNALLPDIVSDSVADNGTNVTVAVSVTALFQRSILTEPVMWYGNVRGYMLGLSGKRKKESLLLHMLLWPKAVSNVTKCSGKECEVPTEMCLILQGPSRLLPKTKKPPACFLSDIPPKTIRQVHLQRSAADTKVNCSGGVWTSFTYKPDPDLTVMLSYNDRSLVNLHLIYTSYFLFFMVMALVCYALVKGRHHQLTKPEKLLLDT